ncbi:FixH family protein [Caldalkalibacillus mannanilyticus]|uniref:FixH family protein n=1 Tax=Caldalkalibacillus mannanilyticus TaxID=1418 RepID=UPI00046A5A25|nr:FixH family protein [Caldalkalibacillus mannanilyticus]
MKKRIFLLFISTLCLILLVACQNEKKLEPPHQGSIIMVDFGTNPKEDIYVNDSVEVFVTVTQDGEPVVDAEEVTFEIWHEKEEIIEQDEHQENHHKSMEEYTTDHDMIEAPMKEAGLYSIHYSFEEEGTYYVMYHVTARGFHTMKKYELQVKKPQ